MECKIFGFALFISLFVNLDDLIQACKVHAYWQLVRCFFFFFLSALCQFMCPLRMVELLIPRHGRDMITAHTQPKTPCWTETIPLRSDIMLVLNSHRISVAANVTFIIFFPLCLFVSLVICRGGETGALWFGCPSHQVLCPCSRQFCLPSLSHLFFFCSRHPEPFAVLQAQFCRLIFTVWIVLLSTLSRTSQKPVVKWLLVC